MISVEIIENGVENLSLKELSEFRLWFAKYDANVGMHKLKLMQPLENWMR